MKLKRIFGGSRKQKIRRTAVTVVTVVWLGALFVVAVPAWKDAVNNHREVQDLERELAGLDNWTVAGMWLEKNLEGRQEAINPAWERLFPTGRQREALFLDLARAADTSGVSKFSLRELVVQDSEQSGSENGVMEPGAELDSYRVLAEFMGDFDEVASFLGQIKDIDRALNVHHLEIVPDEEGIVVHLELDIYVSRSIES